MTVRLSAREAQVLRGMSYGHSNRTIGNTYGLSEATIKTFARKLFRKLGAVDRANAVRLGFEHGYLTVTPTPVVTTRALEAYL